VCVGFRGLVRIRVCRHVGTVFQQPSTRSARMPTSSDRSTEKQFRHLCFPVLARVLVCRHTLPTDKHSIVIRGLVYRRLYSVTGDTSNLTVRVCCSFTFSALTDADTVATSWDSPVGWPPLSLLTFVSDCWPDRPPTARHSPVEMSQSR
jgi:hypothetical protein